MDRFTFRALLLGLIAVALMLGAGPNVLHAEDEAPEEGKAEETEPQGIQWVDGWAAGTAQAQKDGRLIFLYFGRQSPR